MEFPPLYGQLLKINLKLLKVENDENKDLITFPAQMSRMGNPISEEAQPSPAPRKVNLPELH